MELPQRQQKNFLNKVIHFTRRDTREKNAVDHARVAVIEAPESGAIAGASGANERVLLARFDDRPDGHSPTFHASGPKVNAVSHIQAIENHWLLWEIDARKEGSVNCGVFSASLFHSLSVESQAVMPTLNCDYSSVDNILASCCVQ
jgi:hypothetical protein